jgi:photosystem II stability/assembly factor-like uncharacterized protein
MKRHFRTVVFGVALSAALGGALLSGQSGPAASSDPFKNLHFRSIGPAQASGRVSALATYEANPAVFYVGSAHGGVWKTTNNGASFTAQFQNEGLISIGALAVSQKNADLVWAGTGESNNRQSTGWGGGIYKSADGGKSWKLMGLPQSEHINRIVIDADNDNVVLVAATGPLFRNGGDRGIYKTTDGGATWKQVLKVDDMTGANDLVQSAADPLRLDVSASALGVLHGGRRPGQRHLEVDRRRRHVDASHRQRPAVGQLRPYRPRRVPAQRQHRVRGDSDRKRGRRWPWRGRAGRRWRRRSRSGRGGRGPGGGRRRHLPHR